MRLGSDKRAAWRGGDGPWFWKLGHSNSGKMAGVIRGIPVQGGAVRSLGPEMPAPPCGKAGVASSLATSWGWRPPTRRGRAAIPTGKIRNLGKPISRESPRDSACRIQLPGEFAGKSRIHGIFLGLGDFPANPPVNFPGNSPDVGFPGQFPGSLALAPDFPRDSPGGFPGNRTPRPVYRGISREIRARRPDFPVFCHSGYY